MSAIKHKSYWQRPADVERRWHHFDATDATLGKLAVRAARLLMGKTRPEYTPGVDMGDFVVVTNAARVRVSGRKREQKVYRYHTGYVGGLREISYEQMLEKHPEKIVQLAVRRMLPKNTLGKKMLSRLKVYAGEEHPHEAQHPEKAEI